MTIYGWTCIDIGLPEVGKQVLAICTNRMKGAFAFDEKYLALDELKPGNIFRSELIGYGKVLAWKYAPEIPKYFIDIHKTTLSDQK